MPKVKITQPDTDEANDWQFRASGPTEIIDDAGDSASGNEATGAVGGGTDIVAFSGVPVAFEADRPWDMDYQLNMGGGWGPIVPTLLNAAIVDIRSSGAHYVMSVPSPGKILKGDKADKTDGVLDASNQLVSGNVIDGGVDSWRVWPPSVGLDIVADGEAEARVRGSGEGWRSVPTCQPEMRF